MLGPYKLGLTGSIGTGKSTTAAMFAAEGVPVWDADNAVAKFYLPNAAGSKALETLVPLAVGASGVDRAKLRSAIQADAGLLGKIEAMIHPLLVQDRQNFLDDHHAAPIVLFDLPLLFETGADQWLDGVLVVTVSPELQRDRVLARPSMTPEFLNNILARQLPDAEKRARADWVIDTGLGMENARMCVLELLAQLRETVRHA